MCTLVQNIIDLSGLELIATQPPFKIARVGGRYRWTRVLAVFPGGKITSLLPMPPAEPAASDDPASRIPPLDIGFSRKSRKPIPSNGCKPRAAPFGTVWRTLWPESTCGKPAKATGFLLRNRKAQIDRRTHGTAQWPR